MSGALPRRAGLGLRATHHDLVLEQRPEAAWFEVHSENFFAPGGAQPRVLERVREHWPLALHGVGLGLGSATPLDLAHVAELRRLAARFEPAVVSEHLCWGAVPGRHLNDLLPLPYTEEALAHVVARTRELQERLGRRVLIENVSSYLRFADAQLEEWDFLAALAHEADCLLLLDINNIYVNACNHGFDARRFLEAIPVQCVAEIHLAGHSINRFEDREIRIDTHSTRVCEEVWALYAAAIARCGRVPTLIEWDTDIPAFEVLQSEARRADDVAAAAAAPR